MKSRGFKIYCYIDVGIDAICSIQWAACQGKCRELLPQQPVKHTLAVSETGIYIVRLQDASLAAYQGGIAGLRATSPEATGARRSGSLQRRQPGLPGLPEWQSKANCCATWPMPLVTRLKPCTSTRMC